MTDDRKDQTALKNRMAEATSPYLLQHAHNPVHWQPWGEEAFAIAKARDVPVLLSVGYAACHWCHVMAHESFEDEAIAQELNEHFVCIKVDREERPDVDAVYMAVTVALNHGRGGWPMTVALTPDKEPFFAGTYFPPRAKGGMPGFLPLLQRIADMWRDQRAELMQMAGQITSAVQAEAPPEPGEVPGPAAAGRLLAQAEVTLAERYDVTSGGFTPAPKFPHTEILRLLVLRHKQAPALARMVRHTLDEMAQGGLYDLVGGGFSRYSVDAQWHVPHFEKMLYDNALLAATYAEAAMAFGSPGYRRVAQATLDFVLRELRHPDGTFYASLDADSEGHEGRFYVWTFKEARRVLAPSMPRQQAEDVLRALGCTDSGNWEGGLNIPRLRHGLPGDDEAIEQACALLFAARTGRQRPGTDSKILTGHNGLMLSALALGCRALSDPGYLAHGCRAAEALWLKAMGPDGVLMRLPVTEGGPHIEGMLEDYAYLAEGLLALYEAGGPPHLVHKCVQLCHALVQQFADPHSGALFQTGRDHEALLFRPKESHDGATPSAYAVAAHTLLRAATHAGDGALQAAGQAALGAMAAEIEAAPHAHCRALLALDFAHHPGDEAAFVAAYAPWHDSNGALFAALVGPYAPHRLIAHNNGENLAQPGPLLLHRPPRGDSPTIYLCRGQSCAPPITDLGELKRALA